MGAFDEGTPAGLKPWAWTIRHKDFSEYDGEVDDYLACQVDILDPAEGLGTFSLTLRYTSPHRALLETPGYGVVMRRHGSTEVLASGRVVLPQTQIASDGLSVTYEGNLDEWELTSDVAIPSPAQDPAAGNNLVATVKDTRTGTAEAVLLGFVKDNIGSTAFNGGGLDRRRSYLTVPASSGRGSSGTWVGEFTPLDELAQAIVAASGITYRVKQLAAGGGIEVVIRARADVSDEVIFSQADATMDQAQYGTRAPSATMAISVDSTDTVRTVAYAFDATAETKWGMRAVVTTSSGGADGTPAQAAGAALTEGAESFQADVEPVVLPGAPQPFVDYFLGDTVAVVKLDGTVVLERLTSLSYTHEGGTDQKAPIITPGVGVLPILRHDPLSGYIVKTIKPVIRKLKRKKG